MKGIHYDAYWDRLLVSYTDSDNISLATCTFISIDTRSQGDPLTAGKKLTWQNSTSSVGKKEILSTPAGVIINTDNVHVGLTKVLVSKLPNCFPYALTSDSRFVYWTDWASQSVMRLNKERPDEVLKLVDLPPVKSKANWHPGAFGIVADADVPVHCQQDVNKIQIQQQTRHEIDILVTTESRDESANLQPNVDNSTESLTMLTESKKNEAINDNPLNFINESNSLKTNISQNTEPYLSVENQDESISQDVASIFSLKSTESSLVYQPEYNEYYITNETKLVGSANASEFTHQPRELALETTNEKKLLGSANASEFTHHPRELASSLYHM